jgi:hypothetical protein
MELNSRLSMACGVLLICIAVIAIIYGACPIGLFTATIGAIFIVIGKLMA